tara:strand:+ start:2046 stop:2804 length:759 start_codon:yes stop_codon:yes gene_type:complete
MKKLTAAICLTLAVLLGKEVRGSELPVCEDSPKEIRSNAEYAEWDNCQGKYVSRAHESSWKYAGEFKDGKHHGQGTYTYEDGTKYVGEFRNGSFHGQGAYTDAWGKYVGEFEDDVRHGEGTYFVDGRVVFKGTWKNGVALKVSPTVTTRKSPPPSKSTDYSEYSDKKVCDGVYEARRQHIKIAKLPGLRCQQFGGKVSSTVNAQKSAPPSKSAEFQKVLTAYLLDDYATALREWKPLAEQGNAYAQYNLAQM